MKYLVVFLAFAQFAWCDVKPYAFGYAAGRFPGHIDRTHTEISDGEVVKGSYSYVDPHFRVRTVDYTADKQGFHPVLSHHQRAIPLDTPIVAAAKDKHLHLYAAIANEHHAGVANAPLPRDTVSVAHAKANHYDMFQKIAEEHARIAAERAAERAAIAATAEPNLVVEGHEYEHY